MFLTTKTSIKEVFPMSKIITQKLKYKQSVIKYSFKFGVSNASRKFNENRRTIYRWIKRYDGTLESLKDKSHKPKSHPNEHTKEEIKLIKNYKNNNQDTGLVVLWVKLRAAGYKRTIQGLYHVMRRLGIYKKAPTKRKKVQPPEVPIATYPGERVQIDVKFVPRENLSKELKEKGERFYQYTAIDEYTRIRYTYFCREHTTYESAKFIDRVVRYFPFKIKLVQTDNGFEFTNKLSWNVSTRNRETLFEERLRKLKITYHTTRPHTPTENGKVERSHRKDQERFYYKRIFLSLEDLKEKGKRWLIEYNNFPMRPLKWLSPKEKLLEYQGILSVK